MTPMAEVKSIIESIVRRAGETVQHSALQKAIHTEDSHRRHTRVRTIYTALFSFKNPPFNLRIITDENRLIACIEAGVETVSASMIHAWSVPERSWQVVAYVEEEKPICLVSYDIPVANWRGIHSFVADDVILKAQRNIYFQGKDADGIRGKDADDITMNLTYDLERRDSVLKIFHQFGVEAGSYPAIYGDKDGIRSGLLIKSAWEREDLQAKYRLFLDRSPNKPVIIQASIRAQMTNIDPRVTRAVNNVWEGYPLFFNEILIPLQVGQNITTYQHSEWRIELASDRLDSELATALNRMKGI